MTGELERGCVGDQPQKTESCKQSESSKSSQYRSFPRLVFDTAAVRLRMQA
jgi:hypothetical protein